MLKEQLTGGPSGKGMSRGPGTGRTGRGGWSAPLPAACTRQWRAFGDRGMRLPRPTATSASGSVQYRTGHSRVQTSSVHSSSSQRIFEAAALVSSTHAAPCQPGRHYSFVLPLCRELIFSGDQFAELRPAHAFHGQPSDGSDAKDWYYCCQGFGVSLKGTQLWSWSVDNAKELDAYRLGGI